ncbi:MAG: hypothetical protein JOY80_07215 [Candidatus Dormibacteraeota bacterium]|nr:hypothetical protein [Candidatus Dormibacteraeota bacterium]
MIIRKILSALIGALLLLGGAAASEHVGAHAAGPAVQWKVDDASMTITVSVSLAFYSGESDCVGACPDLSAIASQIAAKIHADWDGHYYKCYKIVVDITTSVVDSKSQTPSGSVPIDITWNITGGNVMATGNTNPNDNWTSTSPSDALPPGTGPDAPDSTWPPEGATNDYAHEFGHILGLDDSYSPGIDQNWTLRDGMVADVMLKSNPDFKDYVSEDSINRAVERSGQVDTSKIHCDMTMDAGPSDFDNGVFLQVHGFTLHAWTCDYQVQTNSGPPKPMHWQGTLTYSGVAQFLVAPTASGSNTLNVATDALISPNGAGSTFTYTVAGIAMSANFHWDNDGLIHASEPFKLGGFSTAGYYPGPPFTAQVTKGAKQCMH